MSKFSLKIAAAGAICAALTIITLLYISRDIMQGVYNLPVVLLVLFVGIMMFYLWIDNNQTVFIRDLNEMVKAIAQGDFSQSVIINKDDELNNLNESLKLMASKLNSRLLKTEHEKDQMETILTSMVEGVLAFDITGRLLLMNKTAEDMIGITFVEAEKRFFLEILRNHQLADLLKKCLSDGSRQVIEANLSPTDQEYYRVYITPIIGKDEVSQGVIVVLRNVTEVRILEQVRSDFVANVSHELRTPLTSVKGYVETLLDGAIDDRPTAKKFLTIINTETDRLNRLISDLLYLSKLETGRIELAKKWISSQDMLDHIIKLLEPVALEKNITIESTVNTGAGSVFGNPGMLEQVLINLLENAIKYSYDGGIVNIEISICEQGRSIKVIDKGIGIPAESLARVFERFYRVDKGRSRKAGGTGLGLSIVKHIVERHRGQVQIESEEEKGTIVTIILPIN
ncbi:MAG: PAS domain-containing sensor histidine kinase [Firmicutes bacterium HGW-Firmicutes-12]|jgi:two-component system phosphate regulon sensor histidine kinase PhoR|nr:MAG: PAS domain-containing sensor histidine kinase [Firmicutes bacterium HGW-Firmicutes-12]